uniref:ELMO domain-containing protein n=1 Tax=Hyaloperonospora arabidopsidis (strain Emoy2) TaxID=559515 RepID=M4BNF0_HYAAE
MSSVIDPHVFAALPVDIQEELRETHTPRLPERTITSPNEPSDAQGDAWSCRVCTFLNHPQLLDCELCGSFCIPLETNTQPLHLESETQQREFDIAATAATSQTPRVHELHQVARDKFQNVRKSWIRRRSSASLSPDPRQLPSAQVTAELQGLQNDLLHKVVAGDATFDALLARLWRAVERRDELEVFEKSAVNWVTLGFQNASPETDFRGGGMLALKCLVYVFEAHSNEMQALYQKQLQNMGQSDTSKKKWYPVCVAGINLTCLLAGLLQLGDGHFCDTKQTFWALFEEPVAFYELFFVAFIKVDAIWHRLNATYMEFGVVLKATQKCVGFILDQAPVTLMDLREASDQAFVDRFVVSLSVNSLADWERGECPDPNHVLELEDALVIAKTRAANKPAATTRRHSFFWPLH